MVTYVTKFQRAGAEDVKSDPFSTMQRAQEFAAQRQGRLLADRIVISEIDADGQDIREHWVMSL